MTGSLTLVATPIGNLGDMCPRGLEALKAADLVLCEDTRQTAKLLRLNGLKAPLQRCDEHMESSVVEAVLTRLAKGENLALVSDAGTPLISDPGYRLVNSVRAGGYTVTATPGPAAPILALILSGLPSDRFFFGGFLPTKTIARREALAEVKGLRATLIFFENPKRLSGTLADAQAVFGPERAAATARELTKRFEEIRSGTVASLAEEIDALETPLKGEMVLLFGPAPKPDLSGDVDALLSQALETLPASAAAKQVAKITGLAKAEVYAKAMTMKQVTNTAISGEENA